MKHQIRGIVIVVGAMVFSVQVAFCVNVHVMDFYGPQAAGVSDISSALGLQVDGKVTGLFAGETLTAILGPNGAGKATLLGGHGFAAGDRVRITNTGSGKLRIERISGGVPLMIHVHMDDFF